MKFIKKLLPILILPLFFFSTSSCKKDKLLTDAASKLAFSKDSILFDTVFTTVGSTTKTFRIYNTHNQPMNISKVHLGGGTSSQFRINVDGLSGTALSDIEILANDSLYVFVQVTVNPTNQNSPLLIKDSIIFETNGNFQYVYLTAIGQDVYLHKPDHFPTNGLPPYSIITCNSIWTNDKPHLIFGHAVVDSACTLTIMQDVKVYLHKEAVLWVYKDGTLKVNGTSGHEVTFQGDRLEPDYKEIPGQWGKIWMMKGSKDNEINWAIIKNGSIGVQADSLGVGTTPILKLNYTIIKNMKAAALYGQGANIRCVECLFANCGDYVAALNIGGNYSFVQCTFGNYWNSISTNGSGGGSGSRTTPSIVLNNYYVDNSGTTQVRPIDSAYFANCIIYGELGDEIAFDSTTLTPGHNYMPYYFDHCLLKTTLNTTDGVHYSSILTQDPMFVDYSINNYQIPMTSPAYQTGITTLGVPENLNGAFWSGPVNIGAY